MTLIITAINKSSVIQVSDRRLIYIPSGKLADDNANKTICVINLDSRFSIAYTGLAEVVLNRVRTKTDEWIANFLAKIDAGSKTLMETVRHIEQEATDVFIRQKLPLQSKGTTFVIAGFQDGKQFLGGISNIEDENGNLTPPLNRFMSWIKFMRATDDRPSTFMVNGREDVLDDTFWPRIEKKGKEIANQSNEKIVKELVLMIRWAAHHKTLGKYIGQNCMSAVIPLEGDFVTQYHSLDASAQSYTPHLILAGMAFKNIEVWSGEKPPWWKD